MTGNGFFPLLPRVVDRDEMMDDLEAHPPAAIRHALRDLERVNRIFGNHSLLIRYLAELTAPIPYNRPITLADIGTGGGDLPAVVADWAEANGRTADIIAMDRERPILDYAAERLRHVETVRLLQGDAVHLPFPDRSIDILFCSQVLHHLPDRTAVAVISEINRVARIGWIVSDLRRSRVAHRLTRIAMRLVSRSPMIRFDGPLSILRAFTLDEYHGLVKRAGVPRAAVIRHRFFRAAILGRKPDEIRA
jgi:SAM-dependent methyltransferase